jgi:predicted transposase YbfD/YdcC
VNPIHPSHPVIASAQALESLRQHFAAIEDPRVCGRTRHRLDEVLMTSLCSMLCGYECFTEMAMFARSQLPWLRQFLELKHGAPSHDVFRNVFMLVKAQTIAEVLHLWTGSLLGKHVAIDGKALRGTYDRDTKQCAVHVLRAWVDEAHLSAGHVLCKEKSNEIEALPRLLESLELTGAVVTVDAMGTHTHIAEQLHAGGAHYLLALKNNQKGTFTAVVDHFAKCDAQGGVDESLCYETTEKSHGRYEHRQYEMSQDLGWFAKSWKWAGLQSIIRVRRRSHRREGSAELSEEVHYYLCSLKGMSVEQVAQYIREHWAVENRCHYVLDVTFGEDSCQVRGVNAAHGLSILREMALSILAKHPTKESIRAKRRLAALDHGFRSELLAYIPLSSFGA